MRLGYSAITWGGVVGTAQGVGSVADLFYATAGGRTVEAVAQIGSLGYRGLEVFDGDLLAFERQPDVLLEAIAQAGVELVSVYTGANFIYPDIADDEFAKITRAAQLARRFGASRLVLGGGARRSSGVLEGDFAALARGLDRAARIAAAAGLEASYHPHLGTLVETEDALERLFALTDIPFCPDTAHLAAGGADPAALVRRYGDRLSHVHLKDLDRATGSFLPLGDGDVDLAEVLRAVASAGYDRWLMVELDSYPGDPGEAAQRSRRWLEAQGVWPG